MARNNFEPDKRHDRATTAMLIDGYWSSHPHPTDEQKLAMAKAALVGHLEYRIAQVKAMTLQEFKAAK